VVPAGEIAEITSRTKANNLVSKATVPEGLYLQRDPKSLYLIWAFTLNPRISRRFSLRLVCEQPHSFLWMSLAFLLILSSILSSLCLFLTFSRSYKDCRLELRRAWKIKGCRDCGIQEFRRRLQGCQALPRTYPGWSSNEN
jgi:hypothetical protein